MRTFLTVVGATLAIVIVAVAGVYGWMMVSVPPPSDKLPAPPAKIARQQPRPAPQPSTVPADTPPPLDVPRSQTPNAMAPPSSRDLVHPTPPPPTQVIDPYQGMPAPPQPEPSVGPDSSAPASEPEVAPETMEEKLHALNIGQTADEAAAIMGERGMPADDASEFIPQGWYQLRWREPDGASITGVFNEFNILVHISPFKVPGAFEWMNDNLNYAIVTWLNDNLEKNNLPVRVPAVQIATAGQNQIQFQAGLVMRGGQVTGTIAGMYYAGDGETTYVPGDTRAYVRAMEGSYQFYAPNGAQVGDTFGVAEY